MLDKIYSLFPDPEPAIATLKELIQSNPGFFRYFSLFSRGIVCLLAVIIVVRIACSLFRGSSGAGEQWGLLKLSNSQSRPISHFENLIGTSRKCDIIISSDNVSRRHAVLMFDEHKGFRIVNLAGSKTLVNGVPVEGQASCTFGDKITFGDITATLSPIGERELQLMSLREAPGTRIHPSLTNYLITLFSLTTLLELVFNAPERFTWRVPVCFLVFLAAMWIYFTIFRVFHKKGFEIDQAAFFLTAIGLTVTASSDPMGICNQLLACFVGILLFLFMCWWLRDLERSILMRWPMAACAVGLLTMSIVFGTIVSGAKNWIYIGGLSIQTSELAKVCFIYAGAATLDRLFAKRNLYLLMALTAVCGALLAYMSDFGAALIFFVAFVVIAFMRSGDVATISLITLAAGFAGLIAIKFKPYIASRFSAWGHAWQFAHEQGFQQTRTMSAAASGGLFGLGAGNGWLKNIAAADTDLVFGVVCEELGLLVAASAIACLVILAVFAVRSSKNGRSTFYTIAATATVSMLIFQLTLNIFGSVDILPLTGVTFPFISNGGSSLASSFMLLAFIKAVDTRKDASFALRPASIIAKKELAAERSEKK